MERETLQAFLRLGVLLAGCSFVMLFMQADALVAGAALTRGMGCALIPRPLLPGGEGGKAGVFPIPRLGERETG